MRYFPENSEYEYLAWLIYWQRKAEEDETVEPIRDRYWQAYRDGDRSLAEQLWEEADRLHSELVEQYQRRLDIVEWLYTDQQLRAEGKTYPDVYESRRWDQCSDSSEF